MPARVLTLSDEMVRRLTLDTDATIYGCCGLFDLCSDNDLMSLSFAGQNKFLDAIGWSLTKVCKRKKQFLTWVRPEQSQGACTSGCVTDPCADAYSVEWGKCAIELEDFGRLRRAAPIRDITKVGLRLCDQQPRYRLDGSLISNDREFDLRIIMEGILQDFNRNIFSATVDTCGFDGLQTLINTAYADVDTAVDCAILNSNVIDWNDNDLDGGAGITWNGVAQPTTAGLVDFLLAIYRRIRDRIGMAPALASRPLSVGDMKIVGPTFLLRCLLDEYTCWSVCASSVTETYESRQFRNNLNGGLYGDGRIFLDGFEIPLLAHNWAPLIQGPTHGDLYFLTSQVGGMKLLEGELNDMRDVPGLYPTASQEYSYTDGGRVLTWTEKDNTCIKETAEIQPRLWLMAPWAQARIEDVVCTPLGGVLSPDPCETSFYPETSFTAAACPA